MSANYRKGRRLEYAARDALRAQGYIVIRAAGSKGPVDLIAIGHRQVRLVQVKAHGAARPTDVNKLRRLLPLPASVSLELWERDTQTQRWQVRWLKHAK